MSIEIKIAICGGVRRGKDTVASYLEDEHGMLPFAFGDELKKAFHYMYPWIPRSPKPVKAYQLFGQLMRQVHGEDYWVNLCFDNIKYVQHIAENYNTTLVDVPFLPMVTDLRQPNEYKRLREEGYTIIRVDAPIELVIERMKAAGDDFDESVFKFETEQHVMNFDVDHVITNNGTIEQLHEQINDIIQYLLSVQ